MVIVSIVSFDMEFSLKQILCWQKIMTFTDLIILLIRIGVTAIVMPLEKEKKKATGRQIEPC